MTVTGPGKTGGRAVEAGDDVNVVAERRQRFEAGRKRIIAAGLLGNPVFLGDAVAVDPEDKTGFDRLAGETAGGVGRAAGVEHRVERR